MVKQMTTAVAKGNGVKKAGTPLSKKVGWINKNVMLVQPVNWSEVEAPLSALDQQTAIDLLDELTAKGPTIRDPTAWLKSAASKGTPQRGGGIKSTGSGKPKFAAPAMAILGTAGGMKTRASSMIGGMNKNAGLQDKINYREVADLFAAIGDDAAIKLLKELEEKKDSVRDPTGWLKVAARKMLPMGGAMMSMPRVTMGTMAMPTLAMMGGATGMKTRASSMIGGMNKNAGLQDKINYREVADLFAAIGDDGAIKLLKELEEKKDEVRDPTGWLKVAARKKLGLAAGGAARMMSVPTMAKLGGAAGMKTRASSMVGGMNKNAGLQDKINYQEVADLFVAIGDDAAIKLLKELEEKKDSVRDPTGWLKVAAQRMM